MSNFFKRLGQFNVKSFNQIKPEIIRNDLLNQGEITSVVEKLLKLRYLWKDRLNTENTIRGYYLPPSLYGQTYDDYMYSIQEYKHIMYENFYWLYEKFINSLETYYQVRIEVLPILHYPGFHIYELSPGLVEGTFFQPPFHQDVFYGMGKTVGRTGMFLEKIVSDIGQTMTIVAPITVPVTGAGLVYTTHRTSIIPDSTRDSVIDYIPGSIIGWSGNLYHSINSFKLREGETRITLQGHLNLLKDKAYLFW